MDVGDLHRDGDPDVVLNEFWFQTPVLTENIILTELPHSRTAFSMGRGAFSESRGAAKAMAQSADFGRHDSPALACQLNLSEEGSVPVQRQMRPAVEAKADV